jgi:hypothetical protein
MVKNLGPYFYLVYGNFLFKSSNAETMKKANIKLCMYFEKLVLCLYNVFDQDVKKACGPCLGGP